jgi:polar amino acid transport system permease protein
MAWLRRTSQRLTDWTHGLHRAPGRLLQSAILVLVGLYAADLIHSIAVSSAMDWPAVWRYLFAPSVLEGLMHTLVLTITTMVIGIVIGMFLAMGLLSSNRVVSAPCSAYIWIFRGTPLLVQLIIWYNLSSVFPNLSIGLPFAQPLFSAPTNSVISPWMAAVMGMALHEAAYMAEIIRAGIISVDRGQWDAAKAVGFTYGKALRRIILPQALVFIIPPTGNQVISALKMTSLVSVIAVVDLLYSVQIIYSRNLQTIPLLLVATTWYLICTSLLTVLQRRIERRLGKSVALVGALHE